MRGSLDRLVSFLPWVLGGPVVSYCFGCFGNLGTWVTWGFCNFDLLSPSLSTRFCGANHVFLILVVQTLEGFDQFALKLRCATIGARRLEGVVLLDIFADLLPSFCWLVPLWEPQHIKNLSPPKAAAKLFGRELKVLLVQSGQ